MNNQAIIRTTLAPIISILLLFILTCTSNKPAIIVKQGDTVINSGDTLKFPSVDDVNTSSELAFVIENPGKQTLALTGTPKVSISGTDASLFSVTIDPQDTIPEGDSTSFTVSFTPTAIGSFSGTITISNDSPDQSDFTLTLTGKTLYQWTKTMDGGSITTGPININTDGSILITGNFSGTVDFDPGTGEDNETSAGSSDIFITDFNPDESYGWTETMGGTSTDNGLSVVTDKLGYIYVLGNFRGTADFGPELVPDVKSSNGEGDISLSLFDPDNAFLWTKTIGGSGDDWGYSIVADSDGNIYITGMFAGTVDFDPETGIDNKISAGSSDIFLTKFNSDGSYAWTKTIGGSSSDISYSATIDPSDNVYITGMFSETVDFDPGTDIDNKISNGSYDIFLTKFNSDGSYAWTKTMGGSHEDNGSSITTDSSGNVFVTGLFKNTVDFDPGTGSDNKTSNGGYDIFTTKFSPDGSYAWTRTIGGAEDDRSWALATDSSGNLFVTGAFRGTPDFDPGADEDNIASHGLSDIFLTKINSDGSYAWTKTIGGPFNDVAFGMTVDKDDNIFIAGGFGSVVDFDPGIGTDNRTASDNNNAFITKFSE
jgi:hypothetical protein